jgi:type I restriction enzyme M protein
MWITWLKFGPEFASKWLSFQPESTYNLNISRYISTALGETEVDLEATRGELIQIEKAIATAKQKHNAFLKELGLSPLP